MIPFDFEYYRPDTYQEAVELFTTLKDEDKNPIYYSGGTEIVTNARKRAVKMGAIIDIKGIPEGKELKETEDTLVLGANLTLNDVVEKSNFSLLSNVLRKIADHTVRNRLTLGGNICGRLPYREAILPLMLMEAQFVIAGDDGLKKYSVRDIFDMRLKIKANEMLLQVEIPQKYRNFPYYNERKERLGELDYPLVHIAALIEDEKIKIAFSGVCAFPFRSSGIEDILNSKNLSFEERAEQVLSNLPTEPRTDVFGSGEFRGFLTKKLVINVLNDLERKGGNHESL